MLTTTRVCVKVQVLAGYIQLQAYGAVLHRSIPIKLPYRAGVSLCTLVAMF